VIKRSEDCSCSILIVEAELKEESIASLPPPAKRSWCDEAMAGSASPWRIEILTERAASAQIPRE